MCDGKLCLCCGFEFMCSHMSGGEALSEEKKTELSGMFGILQHVIRLSKVFFEEVAKCCVDVWGN